MSEFWFNIQLAFKHVLDLNAYDHVLFFILLTLVYNANHWKRVLILVTIFTLGHTISMFLVTYGAISVNRNLIEFMILTTILVTGIFNVMRANKTPSNSGISIFYVVTLIFGIIHGLGFSSFFKMSSGFGSKFLSIIGFSLGVEVAQILIVLIVFIISFIALTVLRFSKRDWILVVSSIVIGMVIPMLMANKIW
ncbi:HupE/UreJ family protein [Aquimarina algiphila]|uniref:HupE/UreJ family protein n=1 Tax=Aquimarina algiphila TaxID=2047982 RepID=UPI00248F9D9A|nr:HupE/UreJ family protein [Aquimarina algiphila]